MKWYKNIWNDILQIYLYIRIEYVIYQEQYGNYTPHFNLRLWINAIFAEIFFISDSCVLRGAFLCLRRYLQ